jgi:hypothetical protein
MYTEEKTGGMQTVQTALGEPGAERQFQEQKEASKVEHTFWSWRCKVAAFPILLRIPTFSEGNGKPLGGISDRVT